MDFYSLFIMISSFTELCFIDSKSFSFFYLFSFIITFLIFIWDMKDLYENGNIIRDLTLNTMRRFDNAIFEKTYLFVKDNLKMLMLHQYIGEENILKYLDEISITYNLLRYFDIKKMSKDNIINYLENVKIDHEIYTDQDYYENPWFEGYKNIINILNVYDSYTYKMGLFLLECGDRGKPNIAHDTDNIINVDNEKFESIMKSNAKFNLSDVLTEKINIVNLNMLQDYSLNLKYFIKRQLNKICKDTEDNINKRKNKIMEIIDLLFDGNWDYKLINDDIDYIVKLFEKDFNILHYTSLIWLNLNLKKFYLKDIIYYKDIKVIITIMFISELLNYRSDESNERFDENNYHRGFIISEGYYYLNNGLTIKNPNKGRFDNLNIKLYLNVFRGLICFSTYEVEKFMNKNDNISTSNLAMCTKDIIGRYKAHYLDFVQASNLLDCGNYIIDVRKEDEIKGENEVFFDCLFNQNTLLKLKLIKLNVIDTRIFMYHASDFNRTLGIKDEYLLKNKYKITVR